MKVNVGKRANKILFTKDMEIWSDPVASDVIRLIAFKTSICKMGWKLKWVRLLFWIHCKLSSFKWSLTAAVFAVEETDKK